jgi:hypothetical protein
MPVGLGALPHDQDTLATCLVDGLLALVGGLERSGETPTRASAASSSAA